MGGHDLRILLEPKPRLTAERFEHGAAGPGEPHHHGAKRAAECIVDPDLAGSRSDRQHIPPWAASNCQDVAEDGCGKVCVGEIDIVALRGLLDSRAFIAAPTRRFGRGPELCL